MKKLAYLLVGVLLLFVLLHFFHAINRSRKQEAVLEVKETFWERAVYVDTFKNVTEEAWENSVPIGAKVILSKTITKGTRVLLYEQTYIEKERYQTNKGSVSYTRQPVIATYAERDVTRKRSVFGTLTEDRNWVTYEIKKWVAGDKSSAAVSTGNEAKEPSWSEPLVDNINTRPGKRTEFYSVTFAVTNGEPQTYNLSFSFDDWQRYKPGQKINAIFYSPGGQPIITSKVD